MTAEVPIEKPLPPEDEKLQLLLSEQFSWPAADIIKPPWDINVVAAAAHPSGARSVLPLVDQLVKHGSKCTLITPPTQNNLERAATTFAKKFKFVRPTKIKSTSINPKIFSSEKVNLVIFTASGGGDETLEIDTIKEAIEWKRQGGQVLIVGIEGEASELVGTIRLLKKSGVHPETEIDALFLTNRLAISVYETTGFPAPKLIPTGPTGFDFLRQENTAALGSQFRESNAISSSDIVITYNAIRGTGLWSKIEVDATPKVLLSAIELAKRYPDKKFVFVYRFHPDDQQPQILNEALNRFTAIPDNLRLIIHQPSDSKADGRSPLAAADMVITTVSTTNTGVALCGAKSESLRPATGHMPMYFLSNIAEQELQKTGTILPTAAQLGAAAVANKDVQILPTMEMALFDKSFRGQIFVNQSTKLRDIYRFKGNETATARSILQIRNLLRHRR